MKRFMRVICATAVAGAFVHGGVRAQEVDTVLATVDGVKITLGHLIAMQESLPAPYKALPDDVLYAGLLEQLIQQQVLAAEAPQALSGPWKIGLDNITRSFLADAMIESITNGEITEDQIRQAYAERFVTSSGEMEFSASHILVESEAEARALIGQLDQGADFSVLAREHSTGPSGPNGGRLEWFGKGRMVPPFEAAVMVLEVGQVSEPVQTQFGWHVIKLNDRRMKGVPALEDVYDDLERGLRAGMVDALIAQLLARVEINHTGADIDPALIRDVGLLND